MSFLSKLFRAGAEQPPSTSDSAELPVDMPESARPEAEPTPTQLAEDSNGSDDRTVAPEQPATDRRESTDQTESAWWEDTTMLEGDSQLQSTGGGTAPLEPLAEPAEESFAPPMTPQPIRADGGVVEETERPTHPTHDDDAEGTRPLSASDMPAPIAVRSRRGLAAAALRDIGRVRSINQDSIFALVTTLPRESNDVSMGLFIVADGMGGHDGGEVASRIAVSTVAQHVLTELVVPALADNAVEALQPLMITAVQEANRMIWEHAQTVGSDMGTTCTAALLLGQALYIGHVGDSRAYLASPTGLRQLTNDHSTVGRLIQLGQLDPSEARYHPLRSQLYRTVGQYSEVPVEFIYQPLGDATHVLLGSDGLWGMLSDDEMLDVLEHTTWPQDACRELVARANLAGGEDNISAVVVSLPTP